MSEKNQKSWFLYILQCKDGTLYTGITNDLERRLRQHRNGTASRYTRSRLPVRLLCQVACSGRSDALKKEYATKQMTRKEKKEFIRVHGRKVGRKV